jgi:3-isopropylmalate dehydratase small subunit
MSILKTSTLTSGVLAIAKDVKKSEQEYLDIKIVREGSECLENILVVDVEGEKVSNYDELVQSIDDMGFGVVISDVFTKVFKAKAMSYGIFTIEVSRNFLEKIMIASKASAIKLFIDLKGQEVMIIDSGEKEYFEMSDYDRESLEIGKDDVDNLYDVWDGIESTYEEVVDYIED